MRKVKNTIIFFLVFALLLPTPAVAQETVVPTLYCLGSCQQDPTSTPHVPTTTPTETITPTASTSPTTVPTTSEPSPTLNPCDPQSELQTKKKKHKKHKKKKGGFFSVFFEFILKLFELIFQLIGGKQPTEPSPVPTPEPTISTEPTPEPTIDPCATPTEAVTPAVTLDPSPTTISPTINAVLPPCTSPIWSSSDPNGMHEINGYFLHNNMWNASAYPDTKQTIYVCTPSNWYVMATANDSGDGAVKTYPNVHKDFNAVPISSLTTATTAYSHIAPTSGNWNVAYDIWINGIGNGNGSTELMIWTDAMGKQADAVKTYPKVGTVALSGTTYNVYKNNTYIVFEMSPYKKSGTINLKEIFDYAISKNLMPANSTLHQVDYGVEVVSTNGAQSTFQFNNFTLTTQ